MLQKIINNKEISLFIIILLILIIIFRLDVIWGIQNIITLFAVIVALGTAILTLLNNKKIIKQSEMNLNTQLLHEDKKKALFELLNILNDNTRGIFEIEMFIDSPNSLYLPNNTLCLVNKILGELDAYYKSEINFVLDEWHNKIDNSENELKENIKDNLMNPIKE